MSEPLQELREWLAVPGRECRIAASGNVWWVMLFDEHTCLASIGLPDGAKALTRALEVARGEERAA